MTDLNCPTCGHNWTYSGDLINATCPSCYHNVNVDDNEETES